MKTGKKYTVNVAYTTPSGRMHIGHGLGHTISDVALRYGALRRGEDTFFGFGMHSTGKDLIKIIEKLSEQKDLKETLKRYNISKKKRDEILSLGNSSEQIGALVQEYKKQYQEVIQKMGIAMDYDSFFSTNQEANQRYTQWTLRKLEEKGLIIETEAERPYCPKCGDIKHIDRDLSEVSAVGQINWDDVRIVDGQIYGGEFECRIHDGEKIIIKKRKERAIDYANPKMQQKTVEMIKNMQISPRKYKKNLEEIVKTRLAKPFERKADKNIGAISPFDPTKSVEALSDSNVYMEFYAISQLINQGVLNTENLTDNFFDYIFLERGDPKKVAEKSGLDIERLNKTKEHIEEIYPVDISVSGFEHIGVHTPFSLFTHAAILPKKYFFPEYIVTSHVTRNGEKMSKSKGNVVYLDELLEMTSKEGKIKELSEESSLDAIRFFLSYYQNLDKDFDWNDNNFRNSGIKGMRRYVSNIVNASEKLGNKKTEIELIDKWFSTVDQRTVREITKKMDEKDSRGALVSLIDIRGRALSTYLNSQNQDGRLITKFLDHQLSMGYPVMPRVTEELRMSYLPGSHLEWPKTDNSMEFSEEYEIFEHQNKGNSYEKNLSGNVNAILGKMFGRKEIKQGEGVLIIAPTQHQIEVIKSQKIPFSKKFKLNFQVNPNLDGMDIKKIK